MAKNVAEELVQQLADYGVKQIFGITGDALNPFTDAIRRNKKIMWHTVRHEETAAFAAAAQAELSGELAVCAGTVGPGALHLINGLYNAKRDRSPVLAITGHVPREENNSRYFQEIDLTKVFDDVAVFSETLRTADEMPRVLQQAISAAVNLGGVAHLGFPTDIIGAPVKSSSQVYIQQPSQHATPGDEKLQQAAAIINKAKSVSLLIGCGCRGARDEVIQLAETLKAPIAHTLKATEVVPFDNPYSIGGVGHLGTPHGLKVLEDHDLLIMIGTDFPYTAFLPSHGNVIQIDKNGMYLGQRCPLALGLEGNAKATLKKLLPLLKNKTQNSNLKAIQQKRDVWINKVNEKYTLEKSSKPIHPQSVVLKVGEMADDDAIFVDEVGEVTVWVARHLRMRGTQRLIGSFSHGSLGVGLPAAIGAQALYPKRQVIAFCGDGAFGMLLCDFVTAARYDLPLVIILFDNNKFGFVELEMVASGMPPFATDLVNPDFAKVAEACGGIGIDVVDPEDLEPALKHAFAAKKPVLINVKVNPDELVVPPKIDIATAWKFTQGRVKEMLLEKDIKALFKR